MPVKVIDKASQQEVEVSSQEAQAGIARGDFVLPAGKVKVIREGNRTGTVDASKLGDALAQGWRMADDEEVAAAALKREESDIGSSIRGTLEAGASGLTLGLSTVAMEALGADTERMRARREGLGALGTAAEIAGALAPALVTGGGSLGARAGAEAGLVARGLRATPAGLVERAGAAVERRLGLGLAEAPALVRTTVPVAGRGVVEGFAGGVGTEIDESVLGEREITADRLLASGGMGALFGAGVGTAIPGIGATAMGLGKVASKPIRQVLARGAGDAAGEASPWVHRLLSEQNADSAAKLWGVDSADARRLFELARDEPERLNTLLTRSKDLEEEIAGSLRQPFEELRAGRASAIDLTSGSNRLREVERHLPTDDDSLARAFTAGRKQLEDFEALVQQEMRAIGDGLIEHSAADIRALARMVEEAKINIGATRSAPNTAAGRRQIVANMHREIDRLKQGADQLLRRNQKIVRSQAPTRAAQNTTEFLQRVNGQLRSHLEDATVWGRAGVMQAERNALQAAAIRAQEQLTGASARLLNPYKVVDNADLLSVARQSGRFAGATKTEMLDEVLARETEFLEWAKKNLDLDDAKRAELDKALSASKRVRDAFEAQRQKVTDMDVLERVRNAEGNRSVSIGALSNLGPSVGGMLGLSLGGPVGAALGMAAGYATKPYTLARTYAALASRAGKAQSDQLAAIGGFVRKVAGKTGEAAKRGASAIGRAAPIVASRLGTRDEKLEKSRKRTQELVSNPAALAEAIRKATMDIESVAPKLAGLMGSKIQAAIQFLASKAPVGYTPPFSNKPPLIDPIAQAEYERYVDAVLDPISTLARLEDGTLTKQHTEALQAVYPALYRDTQEQILTAMGEAEQKGHELPQEVATQLSVLFDVPVDPMLPLAQGIRSAFAQGAVDAANDEMRPLDQPVKANKDFEIDTSRHHTAMTAMAERARGEA